MESVSLSATWWQIIIGIVGAFGGLEFIKWIFNRKHIERTDEFGLLREEVSFLQQQLIDKESRFAEQTLQLRSVQRELMEQTSREALKDVEQTKEIAQLQIELAEVRCNDQMCPFREPPTAHTPPRQNFTKEQYQEKKIIAHENTD